MLIALRQMTKAFGGVSKLAVATQLNPTQLFRTLSALLKAMGMRLAIQPLHHT